MTAGIRRMLCLLLCLCTLGLLVPPAGAEETGTARDITNDASIDAHQGFDQRSRLFDHVHTIPANYPDHAWLTVSYPEGIGSVYLIFHNAYGVYTVTDNGTGQVAELGQNGFQHDFVDLEALFGSAPTSITLSFDNGPLCLNELYLFSPGQAPDFVQRWEPPAEGNADLLLFSAHGDDEQLFFAGIFPYYAGELGRKVQVVYLTNHENTMPERRHEMLDGLYACGVTTYPVFGTFRDLKSQSLQGAYSHMAYFDVSPEDLLGFVVEQLRRFKPKVAVTHDVNGEYGHGQHMLLADLLMQACQISQDPQQYPALAEQYGVWDVPKTYLHLYPENEIVLDWDVPLSRFDGMTAFEVSRDLGFACHKSQVDYFRWYYSQGTCAKDIKQYSPCYYGLYRSTVGPDIQKNNFFENTDAHARAQRNWALPRRDAPSL